MKIIILVLAFFIAGCSNKISDPKKRVTYIHKARVISKVDATSHSIPMSIIGAGVGGFIGSGLGGGKAKDINSMFGVLVGGAIGYLNSSVQKKEVVLELPTKERIKAKINENRVKQIKPNDNVKIYVKDEMLIGIRVSELPNL